MSVDSENGEFYIRVYDMHRRRIVEEDALINHRMMWLVLSEPTLLTAFGLISQSKPDASVMIMLIIILVMGILVAWISMISVRAAQKEIQFIVSEFSNNYPEMAALQGKGMLRLTGADSHHAEGHSLPNNLPRFFIGLWMLALCYVVLSYAGVVQRLAA